MEETHSKRKCLPVLVEIIKFMVLFYVVMNIYPLLIGMALGAVGISLSPVAEMVVEAVILGTMGLLFMLFFRVIDRREIHCMGFVNVETMPKEALIGAAAGFVMFTLCVVTALLLGGAKFEGVNHGTLGLALVMLPCIIFQSFGEEVMFRGYLLVNTSAGLPLWIAAIFNGVLFVIGHMNNPGSGMFFMILNVTLVGVLFCILTIRRGSIWAACTLHGLWNYTQGFIYGLPISGNESSGGTLLQFSMADGKPLITGGTFGIEASLIATVVELLAIFAALWLTREKEPDVHA